MTADAFVDATGDAELAFVAGASACAAHGAATQPASLPIRISGVAVDASLDKVARARCVAGMERRLGRAELRADGGILTTLPGTTDLWWLAVDVETNGLDATDLARAERDGRELAWQAVRTLSALPGFENASVAATGPKIGLRETRHARTVDRLRDEVLLDGLRPEGTVALGGWPMEILHGPGKAEYRRIGGEGVYGIPVEALMSADFSNLYLAGRCIGADPAAFASARVMGTAFATGQAAGVCAASPNADVSGIRKELLRQNAILDA